MESLRKRVEGEINRRMPTILWESERDCLVEIVAYEVDRAVSRERAKAEKKAKE
jgi:hypothetical protein